MVGGRIGGNLEKRTAWEIAVMEGKATQTMLEEEREWRENVWISYDGEVCERGESGWVSYNEETAKRLEIWK